MLFWRFPGHSWSGIGFAMLGVWLLWKVLWGLVRRGRVYDIAGGSTPRRPNGALDGAKSAFARRMKTGTGWITTEVGRQPYVILLICCAPPYAAKPVGRNAPAVAASLLAFVLVYFTVFGIGVLWVHSQCLNGRKGPCTAGEYGAQARRIAVPKIRTGRDHAGGQPRKFSGRR